MMLDHFGEHELASLLMNAIESVIKEGITTADLEGTCTTKEVADAVIAKLKTVNV